jgi:uncharacterized protein
MKKALIIFCIFLFFIPAAFAQKNSIKLLAVTDGEEKGTVVDLDLEISDGSGKVFIETYPLSQIDTQISLRLAKTIACATSGKFCLDKDFKYSLKTSSPVVAGPSAGAAMALLTMASLENKDLDKDTVITGTINSGGVIGPVSGIEEKIQAAHKAGLKKVLIPNGETNATEMILYGKGLNITVIEVSDIEEAYEIFTGQKIEYPELTVDPTYSRIMKGLNKEICERTDLLKKEAEQAIQNDSETLYSQGLNLTREAKELFAENKYYSSASRCFGSNVFFRNVILQNKNPTKDEISEEIEKIKISLDAIESELNRTEINNLGDLETAMIIRERISDARKNLNETLETNSLSDLSYAIERTYSAEAWKTFFGFLGKPIDVSKLKESCAAKIEEVQELYNYVAIYLPELLDEAKKGLDNAKEDLETEDYALCLFKATKSKAQVGTTLSALYVDEEGIENLLANKIQAAKKSVVKQQQKGNFPILGYSYYEYATILNETERFTSLLYAEYGIEMSNLDIYFPQKKPFSIRLEKRALVTLILGLIIGAAIVAIQKSYKRRKILLRRRH